MPGGNKITVGTKQVGETRTIGKIALLNSIVPKPKLQVTRTTPPPPSGPFYYDVFLTLNRLERVDFTEFEFLDGTNTLITDVYVQDGSLYTSDSDALTSFPLTVSELDLLFDRSTLTSSPHVTYKHFKSTGNTTNKIFTIVSPLPIKTVYIYHTDFSGGQDPVNKWNIGINSATSMLSTFGKALKNNRSIVNL
jgi:hypothetical protein